MGRLKTLPSRIGRLPSSIGYGDGDERATDKRRNALNRARGWYGSKRWRELRLQVFVRDGFVCQRSGVPVFGKYPAPNSPVANHKRPHRGDPRLFWDIDNLETVSKQVHDALIQAEEQALPLGFWD